MSTQRSAPLHGVRIHGHDGRTVPAPVHPVGKGHSDEALALWQQLLEQRAKFGGPRPLPKAAPDDAPQGLPVDEKAQPETLQPVVAPPPPPPPPNVVALSPGADAAVAPSSGKGRSDEEDPTLAYISVGPRRAAPLNAGSDRDRELHIGDRGLSTAETQAVDLDLRATQTLDKLVESVRGFCNDPAVQHGDGWTMRMELDPSILPDTDLELNLSQQWLLLRFQARDNWSRTLISQETPSLERMLTDTLNPKRLVSVQLD